MTKINLIYGQKVLASDISCDARKSFQLQQENRCVLEDRKPSRDNYS